MGLEDDCGLHHHRLSQRPAPLCAGAGIERDYERVRCDAFEADPHCDDGPLDFADYLHGRPDGGAPADAAAPGGDDPAGGHVPLYPHPADRIPADPQHHGHPGDQ